MNPEQGPVKAGTGFEGWEQCLKQHGFRSENDTSPDVLRKAIEGCMSIMPRGKTVSLPVVKGDSFQECLTRHGMRLPAPGKRFIVDVRDQVTSAAVGSCAPPLKS